MGCLRKYLLNKDSPKRVAMIATMILLSSNPSAAQDFSGVTSFLQAIVEAVTGPIGVAISALAVMAIGFAS